MGRLLFCLASCFVLVMVMAGPRSRRFLPRGCQDLGYQFIGQDLILAPEAQSDLQTLYLFFNKTRQKIHMQYIAQTQSLVSPEWETSLDRKRWAAFAMDHPRMQFICSTVKRRHQAQRIVCSDGLKVCQYLRAKFSLSNRGTYWVAQNKTKSRVVREAIRTGILLRW